MRNFIVHLVAIALLCSPAFSSRQFDTKTGSNFYSFSTVNNANFSACCITISFWIKPDWNTESSGTFDSLQIISKWANPSPHQYLMTYGDPGDCSSGTAPKILFGGPGGIFRCSNSTLTINQWSHVAGKSNGSGAVGIWINGAVDRNATGGGTITSSAQALIVGDNVAKTLDKHALVADLCVWNVELTGNEIIALAHGERCDRVHPGPDLRLYMPLMGTVTSEPEYSGGRQNGTQNGTVPVGAGDCPCRQYQPKR